MKAISFSLFPALSLPALSRLATPVHITDDRRTPGVKWKIKTQELVIGSPVIQGNLAYVGSLDSTLYAIDAT
ncbi:hypothetical protein GCM10023187_37300 [Nibrella viscosa]|uniref:Uncharacterized protein n=1 Tax=Nibrella viscosa TaxID=1084524 RepID=A0ABP8KN87_9BACT